MKGEHFDELVEELNELQEEAVETHQRIGQKDEEKKMYFLGKDVGIARAKNVLRENIDVDRSE